MKILYDNTNGKIYYTVRDVDYFWFTHSTNIPLTVLDVEEIEENKTLCHDLKEKIGHYAGGKVDDSGDGKYTIDKGAIKEKANWEEKIEDNLI